VTNSPFSKSSQLTLSPFSLFAKKCREYRPGISDAEIAAYWENRPPSFEAKLRRVIEIAEKYGFTEAEL